MVFRWKQNLFWQKITSCDRKFCPVTENFFLSKEISSYGLQFCLLRWKFFLWQDMSSCDRKFSPETGNFFLWQGVSFQKFLYGAGYFWNIWSFWYKIKAKVLSFLVISQKSVIFVQNFTWGFKASCQDSWHLGR